MEVSKHIIDEALQILKSGEPLPHQVSTAPHFFVAEATDASIQAFAPVTHNGVTYKIGTKVS